MGDRKVMVIAAASGIVFALSTAVFAWQLATASEGAAPGVEGEPRIEVLTCAVPMNAGDRISDLNVTTAEVPESLLPDGAVLAEDRKVIAGKRIVASLSKREIITEARVNSGESPLDSISDGYTAVAVATDPVRALGGEVSPGMRVDLMVEGPDGSVFSIGTKVRIVSTSVKGTPEPESGLVQPATNAPDVTWVTLEVPDGQVAAVVKASRSGAVYLVLPSAGLEPNRG